MKRQRGRYDAIPCPTHPVPRTIEALGSSEGEGSTVVVGQASSWPASRRLIQARALSRDIFDGAPASGLELFLDDHFDAADRERAAEHFEVSGYIIDHQLENQLGVPATW